MSTMLTIETASVIIKLPLQSPVVYLNFCSGRFAHVFFGLCRSSEVLPIHCFMLFITVMCSYIASWDVSTDVDNGRATYSLCLTLLGCGAIIYPTKFSAGVMQLEFSLHKINSQEICLLYWKEFQAIQKPFHIHELHGIKVSRVASIVIKFDHHIRILLCTSTACSHPRPPYTHSKCVLIIWTHENMHVNI